MTGKFLFLTIVLSVISVALLAQENNTTRKKQFNTENDIAIEGYDPVAYFKTNTAIKGKKELAVFHRGIIYYFSNTENKEEFKKDPSHFEPQYGGWCAYAMGAKGEKVVVDPGTFKIVNGKLYLFYNRTFNNTLKSWNKDESNLKAKADANWQKIFHQ